MNAISSIRAAYITYFFIYFQAQNDTYLGLVKKIQVPEDKKGWEVPWPDYDPIDYTSPDIPGKPFTDLSISDPCFKPRWNAVDGPVIRLSSEGTYNIVNGRPLNPRGRMGIKGRGILGRWGPNHAAYAIVTRWKEINEDGVTNNDTNKHILQFIAIRRHADGKLVIPGGIVSQEEPTATAERQFLEEIGDLETKSLWAKVKLEDQIIRTFENPVIIHSGYINDPRNTDNAWIETTITWFHNESHKNLDTLALHVGNDTESIEWVDIDHNLKLYSDHLLFLKAAVDKLGAHW